MLRKPLKADGRDITDANGRKIRLKMNQFTTYEAPVVAHEIARAVNNHQDLVDILVAVLLRLDIEAKERGPGAVFMLAARRQDIREALHNVGVDVPDESMVKERGV